MATKEKKATPTKVKPVVAETPKRTNTALIIVIVLVVLVGLPALGFGAFWYFVGSKIDDATEKLNNGEINIDLGEDAGLNTSQNQSWPTNLPTEVPEFTAGEIVYSGHLDEIYTINIEGATRTDFDNYRNTLSTAGWVLEDTIEIGDTATYTATKNEYGLSLALSVDEDGKTSLLYTLGSTSYEETE